MADSQGRPIDVAPHQPSPGSGTPRPAIDGREYWRRRAFAAERDAWVLAITIVAHAWEITRLQSEH